MPRFVRGEIVVVAFPFSTGMDYKRRPALILASVPFASDFDYLLCACSLTAETGEPNLINLAQHDLQDGEGLKRDGYIRPTTLFTIDGRQVNRSLGSLGTHKLDEVLTVVRRLLA